MKKKRLLSLLVSVCLTLVLAALLLPACAPAAPDEAAGPVPVEPEYEIRLQNSNPLGTIPVLADELFAELVDYKSNGRIKIEVISGAVLGSPREVMDLVSAGVLEFTGSVMPQLYSRYAPWAGIQLLPFAFTNKIDLWEWTEDVFVPEMNKEIAEYDLMIMPNVPQSGTRAFHSSAGPIHSVADMEGLKYRCVTTGLPAESAAAMGAKPSVIPWTEAFTAMESGVFEVWDAPPRLVYDYKFHEIGKDFTQIEYVSETYTLLTNLSWWNSLPEDVQELLLECQEVATGWDKWQMCRADIESLQKMENAGVTIYYPTAEELAGFKAAVAPVYEWAKKEYGEDKVNLLLEWRK